MGLTEITAERFVMRVRQPSENDKFEINHPRGLPSSEGLWLCFDNTWPHHNRISSLGIKDPRMDWGFHSV